MFSRIGAAAVGLIATLVLLASCGGSQNIWGACPSYIGAGAECAVLSVPLDYTNRTAFETIPLFVFRVKGSAAEKRGQIWFVLGGPGFAADTLASLFYQLKDVYPDWDYYAMDHRGTGNSSILWCPNIPDDEIDSENYQECLTTLAGEGVDLSKYTTSNAAHDINFAMDFFRDESKQQFLYGVSYGTYLAERYLYFFPDRLDGVILDSICPPGYCYLDQYDANYNDTAKQIFDLCKQDTTCSARMSEIDDDPWTAFGMVYDRIDAGTLCDEFKNLITRKLLRNGMVTLLTNSTARALMPPLVYRINRCNAGDVAAVQNFFEVASANIVAPLFSWVETSQFYSPPLASNIILSELWNGITLAEAEAMDAAAYVSPDESPKHASVYDIGGWPIYRNDGSVQQPGYSDIPVLMLNSNIDQATPFSMAEHIQEIFSGEHQTFVTVPYAAHATIVTSPLIDGSTDVTRYCGMQIMMSFVDNPLAAPDTSCLGEIYELEFSGTSDFNRAASATYFGVENMWE
ncbi:MAG: alpha/beta fold hydrolase [Candidatus Latescibacterota bacterium]